MPHADLPDRKAIGRSIAAARERAHLTQEDVAHALRSRNAPRSSLGSVQRWEALGSIKIDDAMILAAILGVSLDELAGGAARGHLDHARAAEETGAALAENATRQAAGSRRRRGQPRRPPEA